MPSTILKTKLYIPQHRSKVITRPQLNKRLCEGMKCKLTLISAPAGFGKTTLISEWVSRCSYPVAWLSLEEKDNDLIRFISYLVAALQSIELDVGEGVLETLYSKNFAEIDSILTVLLNEIEAISINFLFVLDDYHVIDNKEVNYVLNFLLSHMPTQMHLVIITRKDPHLPLARLRAKNQLAEIRTKDLRFSYSEAADFLNQAMDLSLSNKDITTLEASTEGWIAGLQLAAISIQGQEDTTSFIESFSGSHVFIMDYLLEEVLNQQTKEIQAFLMQTSILDRLCGSLCDAVTLRSIDSSQQILEYLQRSNLFIIPLDNERMWYRYHHLFADLLKQKLINNSYYSKACKGGSIAELHLRASKWLEKNKLISEAVHHAVISSNFDRAAALIELAWPEMDKSMQSATWLSWVKMIPNELVRFRPVLSVGYAWALLDTGEIEGCEARLQDAEKCMDIIGDRRVKNHDSILNIVVVDEDQFNSLPATIATARAYHASVLGDIKASIRYSQRALDLLNEESYYNREIVKTMLGLAQWANGELEAAYTTISHDVVDIEMEIMVAVVLAELRIEQGNIHQALNIYEKALQATNKKEKIYQNPIASFYLGLGKLKYLKGDLNGAEFFLQLSKEKGEKAALPNWRYNWYLLKARIKGSQGEFDKALDLLYEAKSYYNRDPIPDIRPLHALKTRVYIRQGKICKALDWAKEHNMTIEDELSYLREFEHITFVRVLIAKFSIYNNNKSLNNALQFIERLLIEAWKGKRIGHVIELNILQALVHDANENLELALESLKAAIKLAEPKEYFQVFIDEGMKMHRLLSESAVYIISPSNVSKLLASIEEINESRFAPYKSAEELIVTLSKRELEVLQLIAEGLSNREISERLFLALSTVKNYNQNLFGKLQVKSRTEAIKRARELELL